MAIDVLTVNRIRTDSNTSNARINIGAISTATTGVSNYVCYNNIHNNPDYWNTYFPASPVGGTVLCVGCMRVGTDSVLRCGATCTWTVPAGVTVAKFEIWGPGAGTYPGCCCSIQPFGATGAYATICMPVTAGWDYTLCAGCSLCCYICNGLGPMTRGSASSVAGCLLTNFCALAGLACRPYSCMNALQRGYTFCFSCFMFNEAINRCPYADFFCGMGSDTYMYGICLCSFGESCFNTSTTTNAVVDSLSDCVCGGFYGHATLATGEIRKAIGVPSRYPEFCFSGGTQCGYVKHPPIPGFANTSQCCVSWSSVQTTFGGYNCSPLAGFNYLTAPGSGGNMVYTVGGCNSNCGDAGRGGMVRVTYC